MEKAEGRGNGSKHICPSLCHCAAAIAAIAAHVAIAATAAVEYCCYN
jgi:hypothetical protein